MNKNNLGKDMAEVAHRGYDVTYNVFNNSSLVEVANLQILQGQSILDVCVLLHVCSHLF